jgi:hypothetical protein
MVGTDGSGFRRQVSSRRKERNDETRETKVGAALLVESVDFCRQSSSLMFSAERCPIGWMGGIAIPEEELVCTSEGVTPLFSLQVSDCSA